MTIKLQLIDTLLTVEILPHIKVCTVVEVSIPQEKKIYTF